MYFDDISSLLLLLHFSELWLPTLPPSITPFLFIMVHRVWFVLPVNSWTWDTKAWLTYQRATPSRKTKSPSPKIHQLPRAPQLEVGAHESLPTYVGVLTDFILYRSCAVNQAVWIHVCIWHDRKTVFYPSLTSDSYLSLFFHYGPWTLEGL